MPSSGNTVTCCGKYNVKKKIHSAAFTSCCKNCFAKTFFTLLIKLFQAASLAVKKIAGSGNDLRLALKVFDKIKLIN